VALGSIKGRAYTEHILAHGSIVSTRSSWALSNVAEKRALSNVMASMGGVWASMKKGKVKDAENVAVGA
jgi:hypothetical protein